MRNTYVLDTSALIHDPFTYKQFPHSDICIPIAVLNELDKLKKQAGEAGRNARVAIRWLDEVSNLGDITIGILMENDALVKVDATYYNPSDFPGFGDPTYGDTQILICAHVIWTEHVTHDVTLVSNDINLRIKAKSRSIDAIASISNSHAADDMYSGVQVIENEKAGLELQKCGFIDPQEFGITLNLNECVLFEAAAHEGIALGRLVERNKIKLIRKSYPWGISARNLEQSFLIDLIMDKNIDLITVLGRAGVGKTITVLASALELVLNKKEYNKLIIYRPIQSVGNDIGFLPGTVQEKLEPHFAAIMDNFEVLFNNKNGSDWRRDLEMFQRKDKIEMAAISYIRGRSIPNAIIIVDEVQNLSEEDVKTILTRAGENTKIILTGDIDQIDNRDLDATNNGLINVINKFKESELAGHITLTHGERSRLATLASHVL